jgi:hypothetical protein
MPFGETPWAQSRKSKLAMDFLKQRGYFDVAVAVKAGQDLVNLPNDALQIALNTCHPSWTKGINWTTTLNIWSQRATHWSNAQSSLN